MKKHKVELLNRWRSDDIPLISIKSSKGKTLCFEKQYYRFLNFDHKKFIDELAKLSSGTVELTTEQLQFFKYAYELQKLWAKKVP